MSKIVFNPVKYAFPNQSTLGERLIPVDSAAVRLLTLKIQEPLPGRVLPEMAHEHGPEEAARRYRAIVLTTLRQLRGLADARLRLIIAPEDADEAVRFWLLPRLAGRWQQEGAVFRSDGWEIDFGGESDTCFNIVATGEVLCPFLGARWVHAAMLGLGRSASHAVGPGQEGGEYFHARPTDSAVGLPARVLPELPIVTTGDHWEQAIQSPLGPALKRAWNDEA